MRRPYSIYGVAFLLMGLVSCSSSSNPNTWQGQLQSNLQVLGARNWVVISESAFPAYTGNGVHTIAVDKPLNEVFPEVLNELESTGSVSPRIMMCVELAGVSDDYAPGAADLRKSLAKVLPGRQVFEISSSIINKQVQDAVKQFNVLVIKTNTAIPYSNIFIELDSGYWNSESETALRRTLDLKTNKPIPEPAPAPASTFTLPVHKNPEVRPAPVSSDSSDQAHHPAPNSPTQVPSPPEVQPLPNPQTLPVLPKN